MRFRVDQLLPRQYCLSFFQIPWVVYVKKEMLCGGQVAKFHELDIPRSDIRQQRPGSVFPSGDELVDFRQTGTAPVQSTDGLWSAVSLDRNDRIESIVGEILEMGK